MRTSSKSYPQDRLLPPPLDQEVTNHQRRTPRQYGTLDGAEDIIHPARLDADGNPVAPQPTIHPYQPLIITGIIVGSIILITIVTSLILIFLKPNSTTTTTATTTITKTTTTTTTITTATTTTTATATTTTTTATATATTKGCGRINGGLSILIITVLGFILSSKPF
jgi:hypothetical protein